MAQSDNGEAMQSECNLSFFVSFAAAFATSICNKPMT